MATDLVKHLGAHIPSPLAADLVENFVQIRSDAVTRTLERAAPGKFVETVVQVLQFIETKQYERTPKVDEYLRNLESRATSLPDDLRITLARIARASYTIRNKRNIAHKGAMDPNIYDLSYLYSASQWMLSEIVRNILAIDVQMANQLVALIQVPATQVVEDFGEKRVVLKPANAGEELLTLLLHYYPEAVPLLQIQKDMNRRAHSTVSKAIATAYRQRLVEGDRRDGYRLTSLGHKRAMEIASATTAS